MENSPTKKKILYAITKSNFGGAQRYVLDLATAFRDEYDVTAVFGGEGVLKEKLEAAGIRTASIPHLGRDVSLIRDIRAFFGFLRILKWASPDIVHLNSSKMGAMGALAGRVHNVRSAISNLVSKILRRKSAAKTRTRIIFTAHGWAFNENRGPLSRDLIRIGHWLTILLCDKVICVSTVLPYEMRGFPWVSKKIGVVHNGISKTTFLRKGEAKEALIGKNALMQEMFSLVQDPEGKKRKGTLWIGTISELHKNKGLEYMISALAALKEEYEEYPPFLFVVIGEGEERNALETLIREKGLSGEVILMGRVENAARFLKAFNIFTLTSTTEALPYTILEAGLAELLVIASNVGGIPEIIGQMVSGILVRPKFPKEIRDAIAFIIEDRAKRTEFAKNLKAKVLTEFGIGKMVEGMRRMYKE